MQVLLAIAKEDLFAAHTTVLCVFGLCEVFYSCHQRSIQSVDPLLGVSCIVMTYSDL